MSKLYNGYIKWFDNCKGEGVVTIPELTGKKRNIFVHWSADQRVNKLKNKSLEYRPKNLFIKYKNMDQVRCTIFEDSHYIQIDKIKPHKWIKYEDLVSDILLRYFEEKDNSCSNEWSHFVLNNIIGLTEKGSR